MLGKIMAPNELPKQEHSSELLQVLRKYNSSQHRIVDTTPNQAAKQKRDDKAEHWAQLTIYKNIPDI